MESKPKGKISKLKPCCDAARLLLDHVQRNGLRGMARTLEIDPGRLSRLITGANTPTYEERKRIADRCQIEPCQWDDDAQGKKVEEFAKIPLKFAARHLSGVTEPHIYIERLLNDCEIRIDCALACMRRLAIMYDEMVAICEIVGELYSPSSASACCCQPGLTMSSWMRGTVGKRVAKKYSFPSTDWRYLIEQFEKSDVLARAAFDLAVEFKRGGAYIRKAFNRDTRLGKNVDRRSTTPMKGERDHK